LKYLISRRPHLEVTRIVPRHLSSAVGMTDLTTIKDHINKGSAYSGLTQIRLRFYLDDNNNTTANYLSLYSGNAGASYRPQLVIEYYEP